MYHQNPSSARRLQVDVIHTRSGTTDDLEAWRCREQVVGDARFAADNESGIAANQRAKLRGR